MTMIYHSRSYVLMSVLLLISCASEPTTEELLDIPIEEVTQLPTTSD